MTLPVPVALPPSCQVFIDDVRYADGSTPGELPTDPVILTDLRVTWGRSSVLDQPEPSTCSFAVLDQEGGSRFLEKLHIGAAVSVRATATIFPDPSVPTVVDGGFETPAAGAVPPSVVTNATAVVTTEKAAAGAKSVRVEAVDGSRLVRVVFPPKAFGGESDWDAIPTTRLGQTWGFSAKIWRGAELGVDLQVVSVRPAYFTSPLAGAPMGLLDPSVPAGGPANAWQTVAGQVIPPENVWLGVAVEMYPSGAAWDDVTLSWDGVPGTVRWDDLGRCFVDDIAVTAPATGGARNGSVFSGRVTDMEARWDMGLGATVVDVIAQSDLAEMGNRYVGDVPWLLESLNARFSRIISGSGQAINWSVDAAVQGVSISWRDVDRQPAARLLQELAQSVGGALWPASSVVSGPYLRLEDIDSRAAMYGLKRGVDNVIRIVVAPAADDKVLYLSACDVLLEPIRMIQSTEDDATRIALSWREQTLDDKGNPDPTDRELLSINASRETVTGQRRISVSTQLTNTTDGQRIADSLMARAGTPGWRVSGLTMRLDMMTRLDADTLNLVMSVLDGATRPGLALLLTDMPTWTPAGTGDDLPVYLEGGTFTNTDGIWQLDLLVSNARAQGKSVLHWDDLPGTVTPVATRTNRATNPRAISTGANGWQAPRGWGAGGANGSYSWTTGIGTPPVAGVTTAARKTWSAAATDNGSSGFLIGATTTTYFPVTAGQTYTASAYIRHTSGGNKVGRMKIGYYNSTTIAGATLVGGFTESTDYTIASGLTWTRMTITATAPTGAVGIAIYADINPGGVLWASGNTLDATCLLFEQVSSAGVYFDGDTADAPPIDNAWTGAANNSTSTATDTTPAFQGWTWDQFDPAISWNDLHGTGIAA